MAKNQGEIYDSTVVIEHIADQRIADIKIDYPPSHFSIRSYKRSTSAEGIPFAVRVIIVRRKS